MYQPSAPCATPSSKMPASGAQPPRDAAAHQENRNGSGVDKADQPAPQPVHVFPQKDRLEVGEAHAGVHQLVLRDLPVFLEFGLPGGLGERRQDAGDRLPFGDRQAGQVSRVMPPITTIAKIIAQQTRSQKAIACSPVFVRVRRVNCRSRTQ